MSFMDKFRDGRRRMKQQFFEKVDKADKTTDPAFDESLQKHEAFEKQVKKLNDDLLSYLNAVRALCSAQAEVAADLTYFFDVGTMSRAAVDKFKEVSTGIDTDIRRQMDEHFVEHVYDAVVAESAHLPGVNKLIKRRSNLLTDYDAYRRKVKKLKEKGSSDPHKLLQKEEKLRRSEDVYRSCNAEIMDVFAGFQEQRPFMFAEPASEFMKNQTVFFKTVHEFVQQLHKPIQDVKSDLPNRPPKRAMKLHADSVVEDEPRQEEQPHQVGAKEPHMPVAQPMPPVAPAAPPARPPAAAPRVQQVVMLYDYTPADPNGSELTLREGDVLTLLEEDASGWWKGEINGRMGFFPANFARKL